VHAGGEFDTRNKYHDPYQLTSLVVGIAGKLSVLGPTRVLFAGPEALETSLDHMRQLIQLVRLPSLPPSLHPPPPSLRLTLTFVHVLLSHLRRRRRSKRSWQRSSKSEGSGTPPTHPSLPPSLPPSLLSPIGGEEGARGAGNGQASPKAGSGQVPGHEAAGDALRDGKGEGKKERREGGKETLLWSFYCVDSFSHVYPLNHFSFIFPFSFIYQHSWSVSERGNAWPSVSASVPS